MSGQVEQVKKKGMSPWLGASNYYVTMMGASILYVPESFVKCGMAGGITLLVFGTIMCFWSTKCLVYSANISGNYDFSGLALNQHKWVQKVSEISLFSMIFFIISVEMLIATNSIWEFIESTFQHKSYFIMIVCGIVMPISMLRSLKSLEFASYLCVAAYTLFFILALWKSAEIKGLLNDNGDEQFTAEYTARSPATFSGWVRALPVFLSALNASPSVPSIIGEITPAFKKATINRAFTISLIVCAVMVTLCGAVPYAMLGDKAAHPDGLLVGMSAMLKELRHNDDEDVLINISRVLLSIAVTLKCTLLMQPLKYTIISIFQPTETIHTVTTTFNVTVTAAICICAAAFIIAVPDGAFVVSIVGAIFGNVLQFFGPSMASFAWELNKWVRPGWEEEHNAHMEEQWRRKSLRSVGSLEDGGSTAVPPASAFPQHNHSVMTVASAFVSNNNIQRNASNANVYLNGTSAFSSPNVGPAKAPKSESSSESSEDGDRAQVSFQVAIPDEAFSEPDAERIAVPAKSNNNDEEDVPVKPGKATNAFRVSVDTQATEHVAQVIGNGSFSSPRDSSMAETDPNAAKTPVASAKPSAASVTGEDGNGSEVSTMEPLEVPWKFEVPKKVYFGLIDYKFDARFRAWVLLAFSIPFCVLATYLTLEDYIKSK